MSQNAKRANLPNLPNLSNLGPFGRLLDEITEIIEANEERLHPRESCQWIKHFCSINNAFKNLCDDPNNQFWERRCTRRGWWNKVTGKTWKELYMYRCQRVHTNETLREAVNAFARSDDLYAEITKKYGRIRDWDVAYVTDMSELFRDFTSRYPLTQYDLSIWDTGRVTTMEKMFENAKILVTVGAPFLTWDTSKVTTFAAMFRNFGKVSDDYPHTSRFEGAPFVDWDTSSATDMSEMFSWCTLNPAIELWDVSSVTTMRKMFYHNWSFNRDLARAFRGDGLDEWYNPPKKTMPSVEYMGMMFADAIELDVNLVSWAPVVRRWLVKNKTYLLNLEIDKWAHPRSLFLLDDEDAADPEWFRVLVQEFDPDAEE